ncbi:MAG: DUF3795 domain-containing protein [Chloroflexota bacterium]
MDFILDGYCGLYCGACPVMLETKAGTGTNPCYGCKSEQPAEYCATCDIRACARRKGYAFCYECADLSTCEKMQKFMMDAQWPYHQGVLKNMEKIRCNGVAKWLEVQDERWRCANCGTPHSWWDETCPQCGQTVANYQADL